jgi:general secretion pathway protein M
MSWLRLHQRTAWICGLTLLLPLAIYLNAMFGMWGMRQSSQAEIERIEPRLARLQGLIDYESQLRKASTAVDSQVLELVYPATEDQATVSAELQTNVRDIFGKAGLSVSNSQVLPAREQGNFDYIAVKLTVSGDLPALDEALAGIGAYLPLVLVESLDVYPARAARGKDEVPGQQVKANLQLLSLRAIQ